METKIVKQKIKQMVECNQLLDIHYEVLTKSNKRLNIRFDGRLLTPKQEDTIKSTLRYTFGDPSIVSISSSLQGKHAETIEAHKQKEGHRWNWGEPKIELTEVEKYFISINLKYTKTHWDMYLVELEGNFYYYWSKCYKWRPKGTTKMKYSKGVADFVSKIKKLNPSSIQSKPAPVLKNKVI